MNEVTLEEHQMCEVMVEKKFNFERFDKLKRKIKLKLIRSRNEFNLS